MYLMGSSRRRLLNQSTHLRVSHSTPHLSMLLDERDHFRSGRSCATCAKYAGALFRISLAFRSWRCSGSNGLIRSRSAFLMPSRQPPAVLARRTQVRSVSAHNQSWTQSIWSQQIGSRIHLDVRTPSTPHGPALQLPFDCFAINGQPVR